MERISSLENLIQKHVKASDTGWRHIIKEWGMLREEVSQQLFFEKDYSCVVLLY